ncbi:MAG TPA: tetratricopeptide repeat protein [Pyrinomonadaceae bacterium]
MTATIAYAQTDTNLNQLEDAVTAINQNQLQHADELLNSVLAKTPNDADALNLLGVVRAKQDRTTDAEKLFRRAISILPAHVSAHINLAELLLTHNRPTEAAIVLLRAYKLAPTRPEINIDLATLYAAKGDYQRAYEHLRQVPHDAINDDYFLAMLRTLVGLKRLKEIPELAREFQNSTIESDETKAQFASLLVKTGSYDDAFTILNAALQTSKSFSLFYALGIANIATKQFDKADEALTEALKLKPDDVATLRALAQAARNAGNFEKALSHLVQARRIAPKSPAVLYDFGVTTLQMDLVLDALPVFEQLHRDQPREPAYLYGLAAAHWTKGEVAETTRLLNTYVVLAPKSPAGWYLLGAALLRQERYVEAQRALQRSLTLKADVDTEYLFGVCLEKTGNRSAAIETFQKIVKARPDHAAAHAALGSAYREANNYIDARAELERAVQLDADDLRANYQLGLVYAKLGEKEAAQKMLDRADELRKRQHTEERVILKLIDEPQF